MARGPPRAPRWTRPPACSRRRRRAHRPSAASTVGDEHRLAGRRHCCRGRVRAPPAPDGEFFVNPRDARRRRREAAAHAVRASARRVGVRLRPLRARTILLRREAALLRRSCPRKTPSTPRQQHLRQAGRHRRPVGPRASLARRSPTRAPGALAPARRARRRPRRLQLVRTRRPRSNARGPAPNAGARWWTPHDDVGLTSRPRRAPRFPAREFDRDARVRGGEAARDEVDGAQQRRHRRARRPSPRRRRPQRAVRPATPKRRWAPGAGGGGSFRARRSSSRRARLPVVLGQPRRRAPARAARQTTPGARRRAIARARVNAVCTTPGGLAKRRSARRRRRRRRSRRHAHACPTPRA